jgi:hypothetical protein
MFQQLGVLFRALPAEIFQSIELLLANQGSHYAVNLVNLVGDMTKSNGRGRIYGELFVLEIELLSDSRSRVHIKW